MPRTPENVQPQISQEHYATLFKSMDQGFCMVEVLFDESNNPIDYRFLEMGRPGTL